MPKLQFGDKEVFYQVAGPPEGPLYILVNGLTQYAALWTAYSEALTTGGLQVVTFDLLGQGASSKPALGINQADQVAIVDRFVDLAGSRPVLLAGISFGGVIALRYATQRSERLSGLVAMSTFSELTAQLALMGACLHQSMTLGGIGLLQDWLFTMNLSDDWIAANRNRLAEIQRPGYLTNDLFALQNLMESFTDFEPITAELPKIACPTLILNGEHDFLTTRPMHDQLRRGIPNSALVIVQGGYHAFTLEKPQLTAGMLDGFAAEVTEGSFSGGQSVWLSPETPGDPLVPFPEGFDHLRAVPVPLPRAEARR